MIKSLEIKPGESKEIRITFTNPGITGGGATGTLNFQVGDDAGTNGAIIDANLIIDGTFGNKTADIIKAISRMDCFEIESIKFLGNNPSVVLNAALKIIRKQFNGYYASEPFDPLDYGQPDFSNTDFIEWKNINWQFRATDIIQGSVYNDSTLFPTIVTTLTLLITFKKEK